jgi:capsular polysaccharide biosynthesis protein
VSDTNINLDGLVCSAVLSEHDLIESGSFRDLSSVYGGAPVFCGRSTDVLYLPDLRLQIVAKRFVPEEAIATPWTLDFEKKRRFQGKGVRYGQAFDINKVDEDVCILSNLYSRNFFHWLTEELIKIVVLERTGFEGRYVLPGLPAFAKEFLGVLGIPDSRLVLDVAQPTLFRSASYTTSIHAWNIYQYPAVFHAVRETLLAEASGRRRDTHQRVWLERGVGVNNPGRDLVNKDEVYRLLERYNVHVTDIAMLPVRDQIGLASACELIAGVHGAGFVHTMFQEPSSAVIECFSPLFINPGIFDICRLLRHRHHMIVYEHAYTEYPYGNQVAVNCAQLELALMSLER